MKYNQLEEALVSIRRIMRAAPSHLYTQSLSSEKVGRNIISDDGYYDDAIL
jgi:hypothetical protein